MIRRCFPSTAASMASSLHVASILFSSSRAAASTSSSGSTSSSSASAAEKKEEQQEKPAAPRDFYAQARQRHESKRGEANEEEGFKYSFDGSGGKKTTRVEGEEPNFFRRRDDESEQARRDPRAFKQEERKPLRYTMYFANVLGALSMFTLICVTFVFQVWYTDIFKETFSSLGPWFGSKRYGFWTKRNEAVDSHQHEHSSLHDMLGLKKYDVTSEEDLKRFSATTTAAAPSSAKKGLGAD